MKVDHTQATPCQLLGVVATVLLSIDNDDVGKQIGNRSDIGVLGSPHMTQPWLFTEPRACDGLDAPREQRLGDAGDEADDAHGSRRLHGAVKISYPGADAFRGRTPRG